MDNRDRILGNRMENIDNTHMDLYNPFQNTETLLSSYLYLLFQIITSSKHIQLMNTMRRPHNTHNRTHITLNAHHITLTTHTLIDYIY